MAENQHGGFWSPTAETFAQHQLLHVANFWKLGYPAVFNLKTQAGGKAELSLTFQLPSPSDPLPPPQVVPASVPPSTVWSNGGLKKANQSRLRRRAKRASERATAEKAAAEQVLAGEVTPENNATAEICTSVMKAAEEVIAEEKVDEKSAQVKEVAEKQSTVKNVASVNEVAEVERCSDCVASTSVGSSGADLTVAVSADKVKDQLPPLPLCLYCCHRGSEEHSVHYYGICICSERDCTCFCYCDDEQFEFKKLHWPRGLGSRRAAGPEGRAKAKAFALASEWISDTPCKLDDCCMRCSFDSRCKGGPQCPTGLEVI